MSIDSTAVEPFASAGSSARRIDPMLVTGLAIVFGILLIGLLAPVISPHDPIAQDLRNRLSSPSGEHLLGTDLLGRDVFSRLLHAARIDIPLAAVATVVPAAIGVVLGIASGFFGRWSDSVVMRSADVVQAFPVYIFLVALVFLLGPGARSFIVASAFISWVGYARLVRAEVMRLKERDYIVAARAAGLGRVRVLRRHLLPNAMPQVWAYMASDAVLALVALASLSFLSLGVQPPTPEWGRMIADGVDRIRVEWWLSVAPGIMIVTVGIGFSLVAYGIERQVQRS
jgi:peptide/nickel transport system permease protein